MLKTRFFCAFHSYMAVTCRGWQSCDRRWHHMARSGHKWPESDVISPEVAWGRL